MHGHVLPLINSKKYSEGVRGGGKVGDPPTTQIGLIINQYKLSWPIIIIIDTKEHMTRS